MTTANRVPNFRYPLAVLLLALFSFLMSALVSRTVYERLPHLEDEMAYLFQARTLARGDMVIESPRPARAYWQPFVIDRDGKRFGKYPLGWPILLAGGVLVGQPWVANALLSALTVALVYRLGRDLFNADTGLMAAALAAFSPMALLLNGTLMGHTAALFAAMLFMWAYRRMERSPAPLRWGLLAGLALGLLVANRPLAGVAVAAPFVAYSGVRLMRAFPRRVRGSETVPYDESPKPSRPAFLTTLRPLLALSVGALLVSLLIPIYQYAATGNPAQNLYPLVWSYDRVGFGEGRGRNIHTLEKGIRQTRWDVSLAAADLFGWQLGGMPDESQRLRTNAVYWPVIGISWILIPFGLVIGLRRRWLAWAAWLAAGLALFFLTTTLPQETQRDPTFAMLWMGAAAVWMLAPFAFLLIGRPDERAAWTWLLLAVPLCLVGLHIAYWIGSQLYSTRYYFEGLGALAILSAVPLAQLARRWRRWPVYAALAAVLVYSLYAYSTPRITPLYRFNWVSPELIEAVEARREDDRPALVLVAGKEVRWRALGPLMAITSPYLDSDIVVAWDTLAEGVRDSILARFPDRQIIEMNAQANTICFGDQLAGECYGAPPEG
ncbi:MAG: glycosyltransferase family 39 protein [Chloroflexi bacterium]|nr:glycosyltransferase family 39 protein [Chloroflexota bacterium]